MRSERAPFEEACSGAAERALERTERRLAAAEVPANQPIIPPDAMNGQTPQGIGDLARKPVRMHTDFVCPSPPFFALFGQMGAA